MKTVVRNAFRFFLWWVLFFLSAHIVTIFAVSATILIDPSNQFYGWGATVALPLLSLLFAWLFFRKMQTISLAELIELSLGWGILYALASAFLGPFFYGIPWQVEFTNVGSVVVDLLILFGFFFVGYRMRVLGSPGQPVEVNLLDSLNAVDSTVETGMPSEHSPEA